MKDMRLFVQSGWKLHTMKLEREAQHDGFQCDGASKGHEVANGRDQITGSR